MTRQYIKNPPLLEESLLPDPLAQLQAWLEDAIKANMIEPGAMTLATVGADGKPSARIVLFKGVYEKQLTFYTNYEGRKGREIAADSRVALTFWWDQLERQVRVEGRANKLPRKISEDYFHSRPRGSQLGALASRQSQVVASRDELDARLSACERQLEGQDVPRPEVWGGYGVTPEYFEFWQGRRNRMHDRLVYQRESAGWKLLRLEP